MQTGRERWLNRCARHTCVSCPPQVSHGAETSTYRPVLLLPMSRLFDKATQKVKKKVGQAVDRLRLTSQENKAASPTPEQRSGKSANLASGILLPSSVPTAMISMAQSSTTATSTIIPPPPLSGPPMTSASLRPPEPIAPVIPAYARPPSPSTILTTTGSAVKALLMAARDGSDLFLPLKAALVGVVALWDIWDVCWLICREKS